MKKISTTILLVILLFSVRVFAEESSFIIETDDYTLLPLQIETDLNNLKQSDRNYREKIKKILHFMKSARTVNEYKYYELDYFEKQALRLGTWIKGLKKIIKRLESEQDSFELNYANALNSFGTEEIEGLGVLLSFLITFDDVQSDADDDIQKLLINLSNADVALLKKVRLEVLRITYLKIQKVYKHKNSLYAMEAKDCIGKLKGKLKRIIEEYLILKNDFYIKYG